MQATTSDMPLNNFKRQQKEPLLLRLSLATGCMEFIDFRGF